MRFFLEHHVDEEVFVDVSVVGGAELFEVAVAFLDLLHDGVGLGDHFEREVVADGDALGAAFAFAGVDDDGKATAFFAFLFGAIVVFARFGPLVSKHFAIGVVADLAELAFQVGFGDHFAENGGVGAFGNAVHAAGAVFWECIRGFRARCN